MTAMVDMFDERRTALAWAAMVIWSDEGYAQVSVRNVARKTELGHGLVHYYFKTKDALVTACLRLVTEDLVPSGSLSDHTHQDVVDLSRAVADQVVETFRNHPRLHRIRYDLRQQALFVPELRAHAARFEEMEDEWARELRRGYEVFGPQPGKRFDLMALQLDARIARAVRAQIRGGDIDELATSLREDCLLILPTTPGEPLAAQAMTSSQPNGDEPPD